MWKSDEESRRVIAVNGVYMQKRVFIGLHEISGYGINLAKGFKELGIACDFYTLIPHKFSYVTESNFLLIIIQKYCSYIRRIKYPTIRYICLVLEQWLLFLFFVYAIFQYDVFIFRFSETFLYRQLDLPILHFLHKKVIMIECGSDMRPSYVDGAYFDKPMEIMWRTTMEKKRKAEWMERYTDYIVTIMPLSIFHKKPFVLYWALGHPRQIPCIADKAKSEGSDEVIILHAPSDPIWKGTAYIRKIIAELKLEGYRINYIELHEQPNQVVMDTLQKCDFVIDQVFSDTPLTAFGTEAAFLGKPTLVAGEYAAYIEDEVSPEYIAPSEFVLPKDLKKAAIRLIEDENYRKSLGKKAKEYVERNCTCKIVAEKYMRLINDDVPESWMMNPANIRYLWGGGAPIQKVKENVQAYIQKYGESALCVDDKPILRRKYLKNDSKCRSCFDFDSYR